MKFNENSSGLNRQQSRSPTKAVVTILDSIPLRESGLH